MHYLKLFLTKPIYLALLLAIVATILWFLYKRGKITKNRLINCAIAALATIIAALGYFYYDARSNKQTSYTPARIVDGVIVKGSP